MKLSNILSVRNVLRCGGVLTILVGSPMILAPAVMTSCFLGKREDTPEADKNAMNVLMRGFGIALTGSGVKAVVGPANRTSLAAHLYMEGMYACYHAGNRVFGVWDKAKGKMNVNLAFTYLSAAVAVVQAISLCCGDEDEEKEE